MEVINENIIQKKLLDLLDAETNKRANEIDSDKVSAIVRLMDVLSPTDNQDKGDSLKKFIYNFNKYHNTNLTDDLRLVRRKMKYMKLHTLLGILMPVFFIAGFVSGRSKKK